jgi:hypothetical protein
MDPTWAEHVNYEPEDTQGFNAAFMSSLNDHVSWEGTSRM